MLKATCILIALIVIPCILNAETIDVQIKGIDGVVQTIKQETVKTIWDWLQIFGPYFIGTVALLVGFKDMIINIFMKPRLKIEFNPTNEKYYKKLLFEPISEVADPLTETKYCFRQPGFNSRVAIWNKGRRTARKAQARLLDIKYYDTERKHIKTFDYHPTIVKWSGENKFTPVDILPGTPFYLDLIYAVNESKAEVLEYHKELNTPALNKLLEVIEFTNDIYWNVWIDRSYHSGVPYKYTLDGYFELNFIISAENCPPYNLKASIKWDKRGWNNPTIKCSFA